MKNSPVSKVENNSFAGLMIMFFSFSYTYFY